MIVDPVSLDVRIAELEAKLRQEAAVSAAKDDFIAAISRELSNPLVPVLLAVERLRGVLATGDVNRSEAALRLLERSIKAFDRRTRVLLSLADIHAGHAPPALDAVDLSALVEAAGGRHAEAARRAGCVFGVEIEPGLTAAAHAESLGQVLDDLLANAFRFGAGRPVLLRARSEVESCLISVIDHGPGLRPEESAQVFALFQRQRGRLEPGLGVGLWVASRLVSAMAGRLWVESCPGEGAHFHVSLRRP